MVRADFYQRWSQLHGGAEVTGLVRGWLFLSYAIVKPLAILRISPNFVSLSGLLFGIALWRNSLTWWGLIFLALSLMADGIDGTLAIISGKDSVRGAIWDSVIDRITEVFWALTFYQLGAHMEVVFIAWLLAATQEYARARMGGLKLREIGIVTLAERPVRASLLAIALVAFQLQLDFVEPIAMVWLFMQAWSLVSVLRFAYLRLSTGSKEDQA
ncbi:MAG: CDP-alcohol phosphatidyltransferase family protein [Actinomycetes bacterium]